MECSHISSSLFRKSGNLNTPTTFQKFGYTWRITPSFCQKHDVPAIDLKLECIGIPEGTFLSILVTFHNEMRPGKHSFWHVFDRQRSTFCFRRIVTAVRYVRCDGVTIASFPIDRFLRKDELGEKYDSSELKKWPFYAPVTWKIRDDGRVEAETIKICYNRFEYSIVLKLYDTRTSLPERFHLTKWPKSNRLPVQLPFFEPVWPEVEDVILNMNEEQISSMNCWNLCDVLGAYYHQWKFDDQRLLELDRIASRLRFFKFMDGIGLGGDFQQMTLSINTADIVGKTKCTGECEGVEILDHSTRWIVDRIPEPPIMLKVFCEARDIQCTMSGFTSRFHGAEVYSIGVVLVGDLKTNCVYDCDIEVILKSTNLRKTVRRHLNRVQNTMLIPVFCTKEELENHKVDERIQLEFGIRVHVNEIITDRLDIPGCGAELLEMPGQNDVRLSLDGKSIAVNKNFLAHHVEFFRTMFFNKNFEEHKKDEIEMSSVSYEEMLHFLDALYHGTKVFKTSQYYHALRMSDEWICRTLTDIVEKAIMNTKCSCVNKKKLAEKFKLKTLLASVQEAGTKKREIGAIEPKEENDPEKKKTRVENDAFIL